MPCVKNSRFGDCKLEKTKQPRTWFSEHKHFQIKRRVNDKKFAWFFISPLFINYHKNWHHVWYSAYCYTRLVVDDQAVNLELWDPPGQEEYHVIRRRSYSATNVFLLCFCSGAYLTHLEVMCEHVTEEERVCVPKALWKSCIHCLLWFSQWAKNNNFVSQLAFSIWPLSTTNFSLLCSLIPNFLTIS